MAALTPPLKGPKFSEATKSLTPPEAKQPREPDRKMNSLQIIREALKVGSDPKSSKGFIEALAQNMRMGVTRLVQIGNTVFLINLMTNRGERLPPKTVEFYPMSAEPENLLDRLRVFPNSLRQMGVVRAISYTDDPEDLQKLNNAGLPITVSQEMVFTEGQMQPMYRVEMSIG